MTKKALLFVALLWSLVVSPSSAEECGPVNDDYCDCADGSDEPLTSACAGVNAVTKFYCENAADEGRYVSLSRVGDAICDCCDGSDEVSCPDTCAEERAKKEADDEARRDATRRGVAQRRELLCASWEGQKNAKTEKDSSESKLVVEEKALREVRAKLERKRASADAKRDAAAKKKLFDDLGLFRLSKAQLRDLLIDVAQHMTLDDLRTKVREKAGLPPLLLEEESSKEEDDAASATTDDETRDETDAPTTTKANNEETDEAPSDLVASAAPLFDDEYDDDAPGDGDAPVDEDAPGDDSEADLIEELAEAFIEGGGGLEDDDDELQEKEDDDVVGEISSFDDGAPIVEEEDDEIRDDEEDIPDYVFPPDDDDDDDDDYVAARRYEEDEYDDYDDEAPPPREEEEKESELALSKFYPEKYLSVGEERRLRKLEKEVKDLEKKIEKRKAKIAKNQDAGDRYGKDGVLWPLRNVCRSLSHRGYTYDVCLFDRAKQDSTRLGDFKEVRLDDLGRVVGMSFDNGAYCYNGPARSMTLSFVCGVDDLAKILDVDEPETCVYTATVATPAACFPLEDEQTCALEDDCGTCDGVDTARWLDDGVASKRTKKRSSSSEGKKNKKKRQRHKKRRHRWKNNPLAFLFGD